MTTFTWTIATAVFTDTVKANYQTFLDNQE